MRTLKFIVDDLILKKDPDCDFTGLVPGTEGYLKAEFDFNSTWDDCVKVIGFYSENGNREYEPHILKDGKSCIIPSEALANKKFKIRVFGRNRTTKLITDSVIVTQNGGKV